MGTVSRALIVLLLAPAAWAVEGNYYLAGSKGITAPKATKRAKARYTREAWRSRVQGNVGLEVLVAVDGSIENVRVISPLGFGLDQSAVAAVRQWKFKPGLRQGEPVRVLTQIDLEFRLARYFDGKAERFRTAYNKVVSALAGRSRIPRQEAVQHLEGLAQSKYQPALWLLGKLYESGKDVPKDDAKAIDLFTKAAEKNYGPALYEVGRLRLEGKHLSQDKEKGLSMMRDAAVLGSPSAQYFLGSSHELGTHVAQDVERSRQLFEQCASSGYDLCQYRLGRLLLQRPDRADYHYLQGLAWLSLASSSGLEEASLIVDAEMPKLTDDQRQWVDRLKTRFQRR